MYNITILRPMYIDKTTNNGNDSIIHDNKFMLPSIRILRCNYTWIKSWSGANPVQPHWRFYWNPDHGAVVSDKSSRIELNKSILLAIPPEVRVDQVLFEPCHSLYIHAEVPLRLNTENSQIYAIPIDKLTSQLLKSLCNNSRQNFKTAQLIYAIFDQLPEFLWKKCEEDPRMEKACRLLEKSPAAKWPNLDLAARFSYSENAFIRRFREYTGEAPQQYLQRQRIKLSTELLLNNALTIDEIAETCGFCDRHYFSKIFKRYLKQSPARFRKNAKTP